MRLRTKFAIVIVTITLVLGGSVFVALEFYKRDAVGETHESINDTAELVADQIDQSIRSERDYIGLVASRLAGREFDRSERFLDAFINNSRFYAAQLVDANGTVVGFRGDIDAAQRQAVIGSNRRNATYVSRALDGQSFVGNLEYVNQTDTHILVFSAPILADRGGTSLEGVERISVKGVLAGAMKLDEDTVFSMLRPLEDGPHTVSVVGDGMELHATDQTFVRSIQGSATVGSTHWQVTVGRDRKPLDARLNRLAVFQGAELGLVVLLMVGLGYWQYSANLRQTERLLAGFDEIGSGNYDHSVSLRGGTEWEQMSDGFNDLAATLKAREAALRERTQRLQVMYRVLRHNLRNEMSVILTYADLITDLTGDEEIRSAATAIDDAGRALTSLSDRARQIENAIERDIDSRPIDVGSIVSNVVEDLEEQYPDVDIRSSLPEKAWAVALPSLRLAVENVCENACEHNDSPDPRVEVDLSIREGRDDQTVESERTGTQEGANGALEAGDAHIRLRVVDNGPGIPEQERVAIRSGRETDLQHGSGLGLWLTYWVVDSSGGTVTFSENEPSGSVVDIVLPAAAPSGGDGVNDDAMIQHLQDSSA